MDIKKLRKTYRKGEQQLMTRGYVLRNDWLKYSHGIAEYAYDETEGKCVYNQLTTFLLNPPTGRPTQFVKNQRTSEKSLYLFFEGFAFNNEDYPNFDLYSGVSTEMIKALCENIKRNMYAYDEDSKLFHSVTCYKSDHYCPIIFYKLHGHLYIIDEPSVMRSVAESNKQLPNAMITTNIEETKHEDDLPVYHIDKFDVEKVKEMSSGIYLVNNLI